MKKQAVFALAAILFCAGVSLGQDVSGETVLKGEVLDAKTKKPVKDATVEIKNANLGVGYYLTKTDRSGSFEIRNFVPYVLYNTEVSAEGYVTYTAAGVIGTSEQKIFLSGESVVTGVVSDSAGRPISGVDVRLESDAFAAEGEEAKPVFASTNADGVYTFYKLPQSSCSVTFSKAGYISDTLYIQTLKAGETFKLPVAMYRPASIAGKAIITGINVPAYNVIIAANGRGSHSTATYNDGTFKIEDMKPGSYELSVQHQGFVAPAKKVVSLAEGENKTGIDYSLTIREPDAQVSAYRYTFAPGNSVTFNLRTFRLETVTATVYEVPLNTFLAGAGNPNFSSTKGFKKKISWQEPISDFDPYQWRYQELTVKESLPTGAYCIEVKGTGGVVSRKYFSVTSVGAVVKRSGEQTFVYVTNLVSNTPVKAANVVLFENLPVKENEYVYYKSPESVEELPVKVLAKGNTDASGIYRTKLSSSHHLAVFAVGPDNSYCLANAGSAAQFARESNKFFIYTDRPVYRAGDTVFYKIIAKKRQAMFVPQTQKKFYHKVMNYSNNKVLTEGWLTLDSWGTAAGSFVAEESAGLGYYAIQAGFSPEDIYARGYFRVEQYRKPEYKVELVPASETFVNGDTIDFRVEGRYFFGAPVKAGLVRYRFYETKLNDSGGSYWWENDEAGGAAYNRLKLEGTKYLDDNGIVSLKLAAGNVPYDREITLEASVTDASNVTITERRTVRVGRGEFYIKLQPAASFFKTTDKKPVDILVVKQNGEPVSANVAIKVYRYIWKPYQRVYVHDTRAIHTETVTTNAKGRARITLPGNFANAGEYDITAEARDRKNNLITASNVVWVYNPTGSGDVASRFKNLELDVEQDAITSNGTLTCLLKSRYGDGYVWVTVEGRDVYQSKVVKLTGSVTPVSFKVDTNYAPNFFINAVMQRKRALYMVSKSVSVPVKGVMLNVSVKADKEKYLPGDTANISVTAKDEAGKPVAADLSLAAVDESVFSVRRDDTPKMKDFFYGEISNWVLTSYSYPISLLAGASKDRVIDVRQDFKDTAFWQANIKTDAAGKATVSFKLPDNLTQWRLTVRGHDTVGRVGEVKEKFTVTKDVIARIAKPRFFVEGDTVAVMGMVTNNSAKGVTSIKTNMQANGESLGESNISLPASATDKKSYIVNVPEGKDKMALRFDANGGTSGKDAVQYSVGVEPRGSAYKLYGTGDADANKTITLAPLRSDSDFEFVPDKIEITVSPSPVAKLLSASEFLANYPYGCVEQTLSGFLPPYALQSFLKKQNMLYLVDEAFIKKINEKTAVGISRTENSRNGDGVWGWWAGGDSNAYLTGYVLESLYRAKMLGLQTNDEVASAAAETAAALASYDNSSVSDVKAKAYLLYAAALHGKFSAAGANAFEQYLAGGKNIDAYTAANLLKALIYGKPSFDSDGAKNAQIMQSYKDRFLQIIKSSVKRSAAGAYWDTDDNAVSKVEVTSAVLEALLAANDASALSAQAAGFLSQGEYMSTRDSAAAIYGLISYMERAGAGAGDAVNLRFTVDGRNIGTIAYNPTDKLPASALRKTLSLKDMGAVRQLTVSAEGSAGQAAAYQAVVSGTLRYKPSIIGSIFGSEGKGVKALSNGISLNRSFSSVARVQDSKHREYLVAGKFNNGSAVQVGDEMLVRIRFMAEDNFPYLVLEDYLPSGFEVVKEDAYGSELFVHCERRDNRMVYFFDKLEKGKVYEVAYIIRAELAGRFMMRAARMECMYEPSIQGWSAPALIEVNDK